ncbi:MAG: hypothetical protein CMJ24_06745 [Phycisphaerae bacterium]|nr:hypothetical protein [Phycisphaerae bacterium]MDG1899480.1 outer membrane protein assembly factor BamE [Phycisphaerales bacterium]|tara:strand:- start:7620 stop:7982 length:363 start_codon:yes stop_codon:yes gene_type:complete
MKRLLILLTMLLAIPNAGCQQPHEAGFGALHDGMSHQQVRDLLGEPSMTFYASEESRAEVDNAYQERWQYGDNFSTRATGAVFPENAPDRVWVVYFDESGRVSGFREPIPETDNWRSDVK